MREERETQLHFDVTRVQQAAGNLDTDTSEETISLIYQRPVQSGTKTQCHKRCSPSGPVFRNWHAGNANKNAPKYSLCACDPRSFCGKRGRVSACVFSGLLIFRPQARGRGQSKVGKNVRQTTSRRRLASVSPRYRTAVAADGTR